MIDDKNIYFYFDFSSSYSYLAQSQINTIEKKTGKNIVWRPILLGLIFKQHEHVMPDSNSAKMKYLFHDIKRCAKELGIKYETPTVFPFNAIEAMRIFYFINNKDNHDAQQFAKKVFKAAYTQNIDVSESKSLAKIVNEAGLDYSSIVNSPAYEEAKNMLKEQTKVATDLQLFGAPTFVYKNELFWGADRINNLIKHISI
ncbi:2-hydroxychromene-2-carboxylate isomerase [Thalassotalea profundi]|uniref:2-hydroxychromene-2-carboxylate isomerase n=1 Tax=Thalassotalea profundi TaxID=2036687 RepID=A0ABQ3IQH6_9GAMM|nr:2-hydroxychromene-2-carboxylate isomerase [Thalassotalea profundi]GHE90818.1 2-hydroxychromene-2-carboxylate isomerase [Thalassotalea profundi]